MEKTKFVNDIAEAINEMDSSELVELNNRFCEIANYPDNVIYENDSEFFSLFGSVEDFAKSVGSEYSYGHNYVTFDGYGNLESFSTVTTRELVDLPQTMAEYIAENWEDFSDLFEIDIEDYEEEEEEEEEEESEEQKSKRRFAKLIINKWKEDKKEEESE